MRNVTIFTLFSSLIAASLPACAAFVPGKIGVESRYQLVFQGDGTSSIQGILTGQAVKGDRIRTDLRAQLETVPLTPSLVSTRLLAVTHTMRVNGQMQDLNLDMAALEKPCYLTVDPHGRVLSVSFAADVPVPARRMMRTLVSGLELVQAETGVRTWKVAQDTVNGEAQAAYRFVSNSVVEKRIVAYPIHRKIGPKGTPEMSPATQGALRFSFQKGELQRVGGTFSTQFRLNGKVFSESRDLFQLTRLSGRTEPKAELEAQAASYRAQCAIAIPTPLHAYDKSAVAQQTAWTPLLKGATVPSLLADLAADDAKNVQNDSGLFDRLCALMTLHPETCDAFEKALATAQADRFSTRMILAALSSVSGAAQQGSSSPSPAMQAAERALTGVLASHRTEPRMVVQTASSLGLIGAPSAEMERLLEALADSHDADIAGSSTLALGGVAQHGSAAVAKVAITYLKRQLPNADAVRQQTLLAALGNSGSIDALDALALYAHHSSATLRATAMMSLRLVPGARATNLLHAGLHDADPEVRLGAVRAFQFRPFTAADIHTFTALVATEKTEQVRLAVLENLHLEASYYPQVRSTLQHAAAHDASADIRRTAAGWLLS